MKKLIPAIVALAQKYNSNEFNARFEIGPNHISIHKFGIGGGQVIEVTLINELQDNSQYTLLKPKPPLKDDYIFLDDLRNDILKELERQITLPTVLIKAAERKLMMEGLRDDQPDPRMESYRTKFALTNEDVNLLHQFFSPNRVVMGLTKEEVRMCILLVPARREYAEKPTTYARELPSVLFKDADKEVSRKEALQEVLYTMLIHLANRPDKINFS